MAAPPPEPPDENKGQNPLVDALFRAVACIAIGVIGFWYPLWADRKNDESADSRIGMLFLWSLPIILGFAIWVTAGLAANGFKVLGCRRGLGLALVTAAIAVCWSPILYVGFGILWSIIHLSQ